MIAKTQLGFKSPPPQGDNTLNMELNQLVTYLTQEAQLQGLEKVLQELLSAREISDINKRIKIIQLLEQGQAQRQVAQALGVGIATVTRGAKIVQAKQAAQQEGNGYE